MRAGMPPLVGWWTPAAPWRAVRRTRAWSCRAAAASAPQGRDALRPQVGDASLRQRIHLAEVIQRALSLVQVHAEAFGVRVPTLPQRLPTQCGRTFEQLLMVETVGRHGVERSHERERGPLPPHPIARAPDLHPSADEVLVCRRMVAAGRFAGVNTRGDQVVRGSGDAAGGEEPAHDLAAPCRQGQLCIQGQAQPILGQADASTESARRGTGGTPAHAESPSVADVRSDEVALIVGEDQWREGHEAPVPPSMAAVARRYSSASQALERCR